MTKNDMVTFNHKFIVCLKGKSNIGKTGTIVALRDILVARYGQIFTNNIDISNVNFNIDGWITRKTTKVHIGLDSFGDNGPIMRNRLPILARKKCQIIFCTCRSQGDPYQAVVDFANQYGYALITTAPYTIEIPPASLNVNAMNQMKAEHLEAFIP
jgi:hypothetical protein